MAIRYDHLARVGGNIEDCRVCIVAVSCIKSKI